MVFLPVFFINGWFPLVAGGQAGSFSEMRSATLFAASSVGIFESEGT